MLSLVLTVHPTLTLTCPRGANLATQKAKGLISRSLPINKVHKTRWPSNTSKSTDPKVRCVRATGVVVSSGFPKVFLQLSYFFLFMKLIFVGVCFFCFWNVWCLAFLFWNVCLVRSLCYVSHLPVPGHPAHASFCICLGFQIVVLEVGLWFWNSCCLIT